jgi:hypothetical protein
MRLFECSQGKIDLNCCERSELDLLSWLAFKCWGPEIFRSYRANWLTVQVLMLKMVCLACCKEVADLSWRLGFVEIGVDWEQPNRLVGKLNSDQKIGLCYTSKKCLVFLQGVRKVVNL